MRYNKLFILALTAGVFAMPSLGHADTAIGVDAASGTTIGSDRIQEMETDLEAQNDVRLGVDLGGESDSSAQADVDADTDAQTTMETKGYSDFTSLDVDLDGEISLQEYAMFDAVNETSKSFTELDVDGDGSLSADEFDSAVDINNDASAGMTAAQ